MELIPSAEPPLPPPPPTDCARTPKDAAPAVRTLAPAAVVTCTVPPTLPSPPAPPMDTKPELLPPLPPPPPTDWARTPKLFAPWVKRADPASRLTVTVPDLPPPPPAPAPSDTSPLSDPPVPPAPPMDWARIACESRPLVLIVPEFVTVTAFPFPPGLPDAASPTTPLVDPPLPPLPPSDWAMMPWCSFPMVLIVPLFTTVVVPDWAGAPGLPPLLKITPSPPSPPLPAWLDARMPMPFPEMLVELVTLTLPARPAAPP